MTQAPLFLPDLLPVGKAAKELSVSRWTIYRKVKKGKLLGILVGGLLFIPLSEIRRLKGD